MEPYRLANQYDQDEEALDQERQAVATELARQGYEWEMNEAQAEAEALEDEAEAEDYEGGPEKPELDSELDEDVQIEADLSDLEGEKRATERGRISLPETVIVITATAFVDFFELVTAFAEAFPLVGLVAIVKGFVIAAKTKAATVVIKIISTIGKVLGFAGPIGKAVSAAIKVVSLPAKLIVSGIKAVAAGLMAMGSILLVTGVIWWFFTFSFGLFVSMGLIIWSIMRGAHYMLLRRLIIILAGVLLDAATAGALPTRTIAVVIAIWLNNKSTNKKVREIQTKIDGAIIALGRVPLLV